MLSRLGSSLLNFWRGMLNVGRFDAPLASIGICDGYSLSTITCILHLTLSKHVKARERVLYMYLCNIAMHRRCSSRSGGFPSHQPPL
jgi:hypothetical protein